ncbi:MAG: hypothetical protein ACI9OJ_003342 [Myxococcota bacterium]|jgi:hypothetical protein
MHSPRLENSPLFSTTHRAVCIAAALTATLLTAPAAFATDNTGAITTTTDTTSERYSLTEGTLELRLDDESMMGHPTNYPHRHRRRVVRRPVKPAPATRNRGFGDDRSSIYFGIGGMGNVFIEGDRDATKVYRGGGGFDFMFGARFSKMFALELNYFVAFQSTDRSTVTQLQITDATLQGITLDGKLFFLPSSARIEPFAQFGVGAFFLTENFREELSGFGFNAGVGVDVRLSRMFAIGARALWRGFYIDNSANDYYGVATESAFLNTISGEAYLQVHF